MTRNPTRVRATSQALRRVLYACAALAIACSAQAQTSSKGKCPWRWQGESWRAPDKRQHIMGGAAIGLAIGLIARSPGDGFAAGAGVGAAWEFASWVSGRGYCSGMDLAATALGAALGASGSGLILYVDRRGTPMMAYSTRW